MGIKEKVWKRATKELNYDDTKRNFEYEEPIMDLTIEEVEKEIEDLRKELGWNAYVKKFIRKLKLRLRGN